MNCVILAGMTMKFGSLFAIRKSIKIQNQELALLLYNGFTFSAAVLLLRVLCDKKNQWSAMHTKKCPNNLDSEKSLTDGLDAKLIICGNLEGASQFFVSWKIYYVTFFVWNILSLFLLINFLKDLFYISLICNSWWNAWKLWFFSVHSYLSAVWYSSNLFDLLITLILCTHRHK